MQIYKCIIIEDEPLAAEVLQDYIRQVPFLKLECCCSDAFYAMESLQKFDIDLMFLDIQFAKDERARPDQGPEEAPQDHHYFRLPGICAPGL